MEWTVYFSDSESLRPIERVLRLECEKGPGRGEDLESLVKTVKRTKLYLRDSASDFMSPR